MIRALGNVTWVSEMIRVSSATSPALFSSTIQPLNFKTGGISLPCRMFHWTTCGRILQLNDDRKINTVIGGDFKSSLLKSSEMGPAFGEPRRNYWCKEGRIGWRRMRRKAMTRRELILEPSTPLIDQRWPWPKDDSESLPPELFGEDIEVLGPEQAMEAQNAVLGTINKQIQDKSEGRLFAVIHIAGKQFKVTPEDIIIVQEQFPPKNGDQIRFHKVLLVGGKDFTLVGRPILDSGLVRIEATVIEKNLSYTKMHFKMIKREDYRRTRFYKSINTFLRINMIELMQPLNLIKSEFESINNAAQNRLP